MSTLKEHIDAAIEIAETFRGDLRDDAAREFSLTITHLEDAKLRATRGIAKRAGIFNEVDLQKPAGIDRARENHAKNVAGNADGSHSRS